MEAPPTMAFRKKPKSKFVDSHATGKALHRFYLTQDNDTEKFGLTAESDAVCMEVAELDNF